MIDKEQEGTEHGWNKWRGNVRYGKHGVLFPLYTVLSFFLPFWFPREVEPFTVQTAKCETLSSSVNRFSGFTFQRVKKVGNFFVYGWIKHDRRTIRVEREK